MADKYRELFDNVRASEKLKTEVRNMTKQTRNEGKRRKIPKPALIAAALALALMGVSMAAALPPGTLRGWFAQQWTESTGRKPDAEQALAVERLTQPVAVSDADSGVTVTLDSVTAGDSALWLLLKLDGDIPAKEEPELYHFQHADLKFGTNPDTLTTPGGYSTSYVFAGVTEDGKLSMLMEYSVTLIGEDTLFSGCEAQLRLENLMYSNGVTVSGHWTLPFTLDAVREDVLTLESAVVPVWKRPGEEAESVEIRNIRVSATGIRFSQALNYADNPEIPQPDLTGVVLSDGSLIPVSGGGSRWTGEPVDDAYTGDWASDMLWKVPVDLSKVVGAQFGDKIIPLR